MLSESIQDYLKTIYLLRQTASRVTTTALASQLAVAAASVTGMLKKLAELKLVEYEPYQGVLLTPGGEKIALEVIRHHRLLELYLMEAMGYSWDRVHAEAERLEHAISEEFEDRMSRLLGNPQTDPHGHPIPAKDGTVAAVSRRRLSDVPAGAAAQVEHIRDEDPALLRRVADLGLMPRTRLVVLRQGAANGAVVVERADHGPGTKQICVDRGTADHIFVCE